MEDTKTLALVVEVERLTKELSEAKQDAERYRWLCGHMIIPRPSLWDNGVGFTCDLPGLRARGRVDKGALDDAIDEAKPDTDAGATIQKSQS